MRMISVMVIVIISKVRAESYKVHLRGTLTKTFEKHLAVEILWKSINIHSNSLLGKYHETRNG